ncbi:MAG: anaerobic sulfatase maturase [Bacteroidales bacterium]|nr:anaerobic sulfatase maturase [Bacteroidales bacterium]
MLLSREASLFEGSYNYKMSDAILEQYIRQHIEATTDSNIFFSWHGGEPLMAGIDFYRKALSLQKKYKPAGSKIINGIQTNGTLLNGEWGKLLAANGFIAGISMDGPARLHNWYRKAKNFEGTYSKVRLGYEILRKHGINPEILCVVNAENVKFPLEVYRHFRAIGAEYITFLPLVERETGSDGGVSKRSVGAPDFGIFLSKVFDEWTANDIGLIKVQIFEEAARTAFSQDHTLCIFKVDCGGVPVVEHTGDFYSCDHYVTPDYLVGNIAKSSLASLLDSRRQRKFGRAKSQTLPLYCRECNVLAMCNGECPKNRFIETPAGEPGLNYLCEGYKYFFNHCLPFVNSVKEAWQARVARAPGRK